VVQHTGPEQLGHGLERASVAGEIHRGATSIKRAFGCYLGDRGVDHRLPAPAHRRLGHGTLPVARHAAGAHLLDVLPVIKALFSIQLRN